MFAPVPYRPCPDQIDAPPPPGDTPAMAQSAAAVERGERQGAMLARLAELGMAMAEAIVAQTAKAGAAEAGGAFAKVAHAVRHTLALEARLAEGFGRRKADLATERAERRSRARASFEQDKREDILAEVCSAAYERFDDHDDRDEAVDALRQDAYDLLDTDEYRDILERPVGEGIARIVQALGLDPDHCVHTEAGWMVKSYPPPLSRYATPPAPPMNGGRERACAVRSHGRSAIAPAATGPPH